MEEPEVSSLTRHWLERHGYKVKTEVGILGIEREVILDYYGYRERDEPEIIWVECKGDVKLSELLEGFIRTELAVHLGGGHGILSVPHKATLKLLKYRRFLEQATGAIILLDIEKDKSYQM